ncbi:hypothetical protein C2845_PM03G27270 [Panicum miliaceum]|uniref:Uncharacterized protein n=1 Tax=Panicum miliaceum TaxID=4540 RepID=A0A3L6TBJ2_PANMI|nr:hypothetical protein C2845_PM03G27270 [Panicum miliaceum]
MESGDKKQHGRLPLGDLTNQSSKDASYTLQVDDLGERTLSLQRLDGVTTQGEGRSHDSTIIDPSVADPNERRRARDRACRASITDEQRAKKRREAYHEKKQQMLGTDGAEQRQAYHASKPEHHKLSEEQRRRNSAESKKAYKRMMKEFQANNLHPDS